MAASILNVRDLHFYLFELFDAQALTARPRYAEHSKETYLAAIETGRKIAQRYFLPIRQKVDVQQPTFDGKQVHMLPEIKPAIDAVIQSGLACPEADYEWGGMQLPAIVASVATSFLSAAGSTTLGYTSLTNANCNLIEAHGTPEQIEKWVVPMRQGRFAGTMAMTEPSAGSGLADLTTSATRTEEGRYLITGNKIFISGGDHNLSENIVHLVLARIKGAPKGIKGVSLFIVPKYLVDETGAVGSRNDVSLAGLFHKMGGRGQTSCAINFGEQGGSIGYLVGEENQGIRYMFHMMNEARIMVGTSAALTALSGYQYSLDYAKERRQGRLPSSRDPLSAPVRIIEHADVRRMLLAQKAYAEGAYSLCLFGAQLADDVRTAPDEAERRSAKVLLDFLTPIIKSWPSEYGPRANSLAIQVLGGHGYTNEHPVEMFYRDNRLNSIHEGTYGVQSLDLLARKVPADNMAGYTNCISRMRDDIETATQHPALQEPAAALLAAIQVLEETTGAVLGGMQKLHIDLALANSVKYLELFGNVVVAWMWLKQGIAASAGLARDPHEDDRNFYLGKLQALKYFYAYELPEIQVWKQILCDFEDAFYMAREEWF